MTVFVMMSLSLSAGHAALAFTFLVSAVFGSLACALVYPPNVVCVGASGGVFGLAGALITFLLVVGMGLAAVRPCLSFVGMNLLLSLTPGISMAAHVGGLLAGAAVGLGIGWVLRVCRAAGFEGARRDRRIFAPALWGASALLLLALLGSAALRMVRTSRPTETPIMMSSVTGCAQIMPSNPKTRFSSRRRGT